MKYFKSRADTYRVFHSYFAMNSVVLVTFMLVWETISGQYYLYDDVPKAPLALIKKNDPSALELAIPQKSSIIWMYAKYPYADKKIVSACSAATSTQCALENKWKEDNEVSEYTKLFIYDEYSPDECSIEGKPSIEKAQRKYFNGDVQYCGNFEAEIYNVGFPVSSNDGIADVQFIPIYQVCYSNAEGKGTLYTIHRIESPSLLSEEEVQYHGYSPDELFKCSLDKEENSESSPYENQYGHQFVGIHDMPTVVWRTTTRFSFNYIPITDDEDLMEGMLRIDNFIRLYSRMTDKPLTLYSGTYQTTVVMKSRFPCLSGLCGEPTPINLFWRIVMNDDRLATIIVTQYTKIKCVNESVICIDKYRMITKYKNGGCTYLCSIHTEIIQQLGLPHDTVIQRLKLPPLSETQYLDLKFPKKTRTDAAPSSKEGQRTSASKSSDSEYVSILDIFGEGGSQSVLLKTDPDLAASIRVSVPKIKRI